jgi:Asp-tRNA(Asn)/Glu-tRNA(Gln) amidotransferase A subunit family amidase
MTTSDKMSKLRSGETDLIKYIGAICDRIEERDPRIQAFVAGSYSRDRILTEASDLLKAYPDPSSRPPLFGATVGVKDIYRVDGFPTQCGSALPAKLFEGAEASSVTLLRKAGALIMGKTVTTEFAYFQPGPTRNPHNLEHTPGGSSSGSAAGLSAGFFLVALGSQTIGSTLRPAAYCGVVGFKPSYGRIATGGVIPISSLLDHVGVFTNDTSGLSLVLPILCGDWHETAGPTAPSKIPVLGIPEGPYMRQASANALSQFEKQCDRLQTAGYPVKPMKTLEDIEKINRSHNTLLAADIVKVHAEWLKDHRPLYSPKILKLFDEGQKVSPEALPRLREVPTSLRRRLEKQMQSEGVDFLICPAATDHAPQGLESTGDPIMNLPWTCAGLPSVSVPAGRDEANLPLGMQIVAPFMKDEQLIAAAGEMESIVRGEEGSCRGTGHCGEGE